MAEAARHSPPPQQALALPPGWHPQEAGPQGQDAPLAAARRALRRAPSPSLRSAAAALALLVAGAPLPDHGGEAGRRRFDRGIARIARLVRDDDGR